MRLASINTPSGLRLHVRGRSGYVDVAEATGQDGYVTLQGLLNAGPAGLEAARSAAAGEGREYAEQDFGPSVPTPRVIHCLGLNYADHVAEGGRDLPSFPNVFMRSPETVTGPFADLVVPALTDGYDYEGEVGIVIGAGGRYIPAEQAMAAIAGFTVLNDASARDWQRAASQWIPGKNFDGSMPIGPEVVTPDEVDILDTTLTTRLDGEIMQQARTSQMLIDIPSTVEFYSSFTTLPPGDVIATGTPGGVGYARKPPVWLEPGKTIEITVDGVGTIRNRVVAETGDHGRWRWHPPQGS
ncbi:MAG: fumarylacetoacetate hydrolase family protein [Actinobacteria bacterium]|nr:fumarylacetoacetate hydrolase family protein [Actinomycetota bacterium]